jgi:hypothetical protein
LRLAGTCGGSVRSLVKTLLVKALIRLVGDHALQLGLIGLVRNNAGVQFVLPFARLGRENVAGEGVLPDHFPRPGFLKPFGRTFVCLQFRHDDISGKPEF